MRENGASRNSYAQNRGRSKHFEQIREALFGVDIMLDNIYLIWKRLFQ